jgi:hypothetical protein
MAVLLPVTVLRAITVGGWNRATVIAIGFAMAILLAIMMYNDYRDS